MNGSQVLYGGLSRPASSSTHAWWAAPGGTESVPGEYLYGNHRMPFQRAGQWGIFRVLGTTQPDLAPL